MEEISGTPVAAPCADSGNAIRDTDCRSGEQAIGRIIRVSGYGADIELNASAVERLRQDPDPSIAATGQFGSQIKMRVDTQWIFASVKTLRFEAASPDMILAEIDFMGESLELATGGEPGTFRRGITRFPGPGTPLFPVSIDDMRQIYAADDRPHIEIGTVYPTRDIRGALFVDALLGKHFALLGSTGTGKSTAAALILHRICDIAPQGHIVVIDPHGEYAAAFANNGALFDVNNLAMPYWLMNFEEHCEVFLSSTGPEAQMDRDILGKCLLAARAKNRAAEGISRLTVDSPIPYLLSDLTSILQTEMGKLDKAGGSAPYMRLKSKIDEIKADPRYGFMFSGMLVGDSMASFLSRIFRFQGDNKPISIIDVSGVPSEITSVVVAVLSRMVFDFAIWSRGETQHPILLVCEEAHRYIPSDRESAGASVRKILERIAKEGRKYGVSLGLITQRPSDLAEGVLSQCGTIIAMRLNNERDQAFVKAAMPEGAKGMLDSISALRNRECIVCGEGVAVPIRVAFDNLERERRPASHDPIFSDLWREAEDDHELLGRVIRRWRSQGK